MFFWILFILKMLEDMCVVFGEPLIPCFGLLVMPALGFMKQRWNSSFFPWKGFFIFFPNVHIIEIVGILCFTYREIKSEQMSMKIIFVTIL